MVMYLAIQDYIISLEVLHKDWRDNMETGIFTFKDYGKTEIKLKELLDKKGITRNKLCSLTGCNYDLVNRYYNNAISRVDLDIISRFCFVLQCKSSDIIQYIPQGDNKNVI